MPVAHGRVQVVFEQADGSKVVSEVMSIERESLSAETLGLPLAESKTVLAGVQEVLVAQQAASFSTAGLPEVWCSAPTRSVITFRSDGGDTVRDLQRYLSPLTAHLLDWFHITMRITGLRQQLKEVCRATHDGV